MEVVLKLKSIVLVRFQVGMVPSKNSEFKTWLREQCGGKAVSGWRGTGECSSGVELEYLVSLRPCV